MHLFNVSMIIITLNCFPFDLAKLHLRSGFCFLLSTAMGNERSNNYWEAELPPKYDRVVIEYFIRAKYDFVELPVSSIDIVPDFVRYH